MSDTIDLITCHYQNEHALYLAYMPFIKGGGLFIRTNAIYELGSAVDLSIQLPNETSVYQVDGKVVWLTPKAARGNKPMGIGVQLCGHYGRELCNKIETLLADMLKSTQSTDTI